jgi:membrane-associated protease RseP (regulator of RpoE activity)
MHRRITLAGFTVLACLFCVVADSPAADAQGFFRRLQERFRSRAEELPDPPTPPGEPRYAPNLQPVAPQKAEPSTSGDANRFGQSVLRRGQIPAAASQREATQSSPAAGPSLGVSVVESEEGVPGLKIAVVRTDSLADEAGLNEGDLIIAIDGKPTPSIQSVVELLATRRVGDRVRVTVVRDTTTETITLGLVESVVNKAKPGSIPPAADAPQEAIEFGIALEQTRGARGLTVTEVTTDSPAAAAGLKVGDRIVSVDGRLLLSAESFARAWSDLKPTDKLRLQLVRDGKLVAAEIGSTSALSAAATSAAAAKQTDRAGSVLEDLGSVLGGLLGGEPNAKPVPDAKEKKEKANESDGDSSVTQAGFVSVGGATTKQLKKDPPSLKGLELPPRESIPIELNPPAPVPTKAEAIESLRDQIRQLEARLKQLESEA